MSKEVKEYLDYLKANEYIWGYEKKDNYIILRYGLSSVKDTETNIEYNSAKDAERDTGVDSGSIGRVCNGKRKSAGGYHWKWI